MLLLRAPCISLLLLVFSLQHIYISCLKNVPCPNAEDIEPCVCSYDVDNGYLDMTCNSITDEVQLQTIFQGRFSFKNYHKFILDTSNLSKLDNGIFGEVTFQDVDASNGALVSIESETFWKSADTLRSINLDNNIISNVDCEVINIFTAIEELSLSGNPISSFPIIESETLSKLNLNYALYNTIPADALAGLPNLKIFESAYTNVSSMPPELFIPTKVTAINMQQSGIGDLKRHQFAVSDPTRVDINLSGNLISSVEADTFTGIHQDENNNAASINMMNNRLEILPEDIWRPVIDAGVILQLDGNELTCGCDIAWLVLNPEPYTPLLLGARCFDGEDLWNLDPYIYENMC